MRYNPLVGKETLAKDFIRSVHHVWGSAENCSTTRDLLCDKWLAQLLTTKHMPVLPLWEAPQSPSHAIGLFWKPNTWTEHSHHQNFLQLSPRAHGQPMKICPEHRASTSHQKGACLRRNGSMTTPFINSFSFSASPCLCKDFMKTQVHLEICLLPCDGESDSKVHQHSARTYRAVSPICFQILEFDR